MARPVEHRAPVCDLENAGQFVRHHHERHAARVAQAQNELVKGRRGHGVETGARFVEKENRRFEHHCAGDGRPLFHAARKIRRHLVRRVPEADELQLHPRERATGRRGKTREFLQRKHHVLQDAHRAEQRAALVHHADAMQDLLAIRRVHLEAVDRDLAGRGGVESDQMLHHRGLAAPRTAEKRKHLALRHGEVDILQYAHAGIAGDEVLDRDDVRRRHYFPLKSNRWPRMERRPR